MAGHNLQTQSWHVCSGLVPGYFLLNFSWLPRFCYQIYDGNGLKLFLIYAVVVLVVDTSDTGLKYFYGVAAQLRPPQPRHWFRGGAWSRLASFFSMWDKNNLFKWGVFSRSEHKVSAHLDWANVYRWSRGPLRHCHLPPTLLSAQLIRSLIIPSLLCHLVISSVKHNCDWLINTPLTPWPSSVPRYLCGRSSDKQRHQRYCEAANVEWRHQ